MPIETTDPASQENLPEVYEDIPKKSRKKRKVAFVDTSEALEVEARDIADSRMTASKEDLKGVKGFVSKIWKHNLFREYYRQREIAHVKSDIEESGNLYVGEGADKRVHDKAMNAIVDRFVEEYEEAVHTEAGEEKKVLDAESPESKKLNESIRTLIREYAGGAIDDATFNEERRRIVGEATGLTGEKLKSTVAHTDNLFEIARESKLAVEHGASIDEIDQEIEIILGKAKTGVRTESKFSTVDRITAKIQSSKVGQFLNETTIASGVAIAYSVTVGLSQKLARSRALAWGTFGLSAVVGGAIAGARESVKVEDERKQHSRERAKGKEMMRDMERRMEMEKGIYKTAPAKILAESVVNTSEKIKNEEDFMAAVTSLSETEARIKLSDREKIDLISYTNFEKVEEERLGLDIARAEAKVNLRKLVENGTIALPDGKSFDEFYTSAVDTKINDLRTGKEGIEARDRIFKKMKHKKVAGAVVKAVATGLVIGGIAQETSAFFDKGKEGFFEHLFRGKGGGTPKSVTALEGLRRWVMGDQIPARGIHNLILADGSNVKLPDGVEIVPSPGHAGDFIFSKDGEVLSDKVQFSGGKLTAASEALLKQHGVNIATEIDHITGKEEVMTGPKDTVAKNPGLFHAIKRQFWYDNDTPKSDLNELKTHFGGVSGTGIDAKGNYVIDVSKMTSDGSFHNDLSVDAKDAIANGKLKILLSLSRDTQMTAVEVPVDANGKMILDPNSDIAKMFFKNDGGHLKFMGKYMEIAEVKGSVGGVDNYSVLSTAVGPGQESVKGIKDIVVDSPITTFGVKDEVAVFPPPFIPLFGRKPLEKMTNPADGVYDETYSERDTIYEDPHQIDPPIKTTYEDESGQKIYDEKNYTDEKTKSDEKYDEIKIRSKEDSTYDEKKESSPKPEHKIDAEKVEQSIGGIKEYLKNKANLVELEELDKEIGEPMSSKTKMSIVLPCYREGANIYNTLTDWTVEQKDLDPEEVEIIVFVNAPKKNEPLDKKTISEIERFKKDHPGYKVRLVKHNFDFKTARKMGAIYKMPADLALYRSVKRLDTADPKDKLAMSETVANHLLRCGGADALGRNPRFLRETIDFLDEHDDVEQLRSQSAYPPEVRERFPLFNVVTVFNHSLSLLYTRGKSNIGLGTFRTRAYSEAGGFDPSREYREEIDLGSRIRAKVGGRKGAIKKIVKKNAIDNPRRELFAVARGDTALRAYSGFSSPQRDTELREFDWNKKMDPDFEKNLELNSTNLSREFDSYFQHYTGKVQRESGTIGAILSGNVDVDSNRLNPRMRLLLGDPEIRNIVVDINKRTKNGEVIGRDSEEANKISVKITEQLFDRILRLSLGLTKGQTDDYEYVQSRFSGKTHISFASKAVAKIENMSKKKWADFDGYWPED